jgi:DNA-binding CsgD family transcriptional regulator
MTHTTPIPSEAQLTHLIQTLYESTINSGVREVFLHSLCELLGLSPPQRTVIGYDNALYDICHNSADAFFRHDTTLATSPLPSTHRVTPSPWHTTDLRQPKLPHGDELTPLEAWLTAPADVTGILTLMERIPNQGSQFGFFYRPEVLCVPEWHASLFELLTPHCHAIAHLMHITQRLAFPRLTFSSTFTHAPYGVMLLSKSGNMIECNLAAQRLLEQRTHLTWSATASLSAASPADTQRLQQQIDLAIKMPLSLSTRPPQTLKLPHITDANGHILESIAWPISQHHENHLPSESAVALFLHNPDAKPTSHQATLRQRFALTDGEAKVADALLRGMSLSEIAWSLRISEPTVRRSCQNLRFKVGAPPRADLTSTLVRALRAA